MAFNGAHSFIMNGNINAVDHSHRCGESQLNLLAKEACLEAGHQSEERHDAPRCHPETRMAVINDIMSWVDAKDLNECMMWLNGPAGAGESSIIQMIAERCYEEKKLVSSFFFTRNAMGSGRDDGTKLVPTIACQLAISIPVTAGLIQSELEKDKVMLSYSMEVRLAKLVLKPLSGASALINQKSGNSNVPHIVIIDGLEECKRPELQSRIVRMMAKMSQASNNLYILIASRPELELRTAFGESNVSSICVPLILDNQYNPDNDITIYLQSKFSAIKHTHSLASTLYKELNWPSKEDLQILVKRSSGQFIYSSTVIKYVKDAQHDPQNRLLTVINIKLGEASPYTKLDALYMHILFTAIAKQIAIVIFT
ncbi:hypothetical protein BDQ17DRAFT_1426936 [Cyathus striatus]|nr:hypothetical protein BDQ17DRAFT_1426936 [Cyathus striatus]